LIDCKAVVCDHEGIPDFKLLIRNRRYGSAQLDAFDLLDLDGEDLRGDPIERRKHMLTQLLERDRAGLLISHPIDLAFTHICQLGFEGIARRWGRARRELVDYLVGSNQ